MSCMPGNPGVPREAAYSKWNLSLVYPHVLLLPSQHRHMEGMRYNICTVHLLYLSFHDSLPTNKPILKPTSSRLHTRNISHLEHKWQWWPGCGFMLTEDQVNLLLNQVAYKIRNHSSHHSFTSLCVCRTLFGITSVFISALCASKEGKVLFGL